MSYRKEGRKLYTFSSKKSNCQISKCIFLRSIYANVHVIILQGATFQIRQYTVTPFREQTGDPVTSVPGESPNSKILDLRTKKRTGHHPDFKQLRFFKKIQNHVNAYYTSIWCCIVDLVHLIVLRFFFLSCLLVFLSS